MGAGLESFSDEQLCAFAQGSGSARAASVSAGVAVEELVRRHYGWVFRMARGSGFDTTLATDVTQDVMLAAVRSLKSFSGRSAFRTWLFTIARRGISRARWKQRVKWFFEVSGEQQAAALEQAAGKIESPVDKLANAELLKLVQALPEQQRLAVMAYYFEDLSVEQTAKQLQCSPGSVKVHLSRAREKLKRGLRESDE